MAHVDITPVTNWNVNTVSADLVGAGQSVDAADTFAIDAKGETSDLLIFLNEEGSGAAAVTFDAGDNPPSLQGPLGDLTVNLSASDLRVVSLAPGRFIQSDGKVTGSVATNDTLIYAVRIPREQ